MITVEIDELDEFGKPRLTLSSDKTNSKFIIYKSNDGFAHFRIKYNRGSIPKELDSAYTGLSLAYQAVLRYERQMQPTKRAKTDKYYEENH